MERMHWSLSIPTPPAVVSTTTHAERSWIDFLIAFVMSLLLHFPVFRIDKSTNESLYEARCHYMRRLRRDLNVLLLHDRKTKTTGMYLWAQRLGGSGRDNTIVEISCQIPCLESTCDMDAASMCTEATEMRPKSHESSSSRFSSKEITIHVAFPIGLLPHTIPIPTSATHNDGGCLVLDVDDGATTILDQLPSNVPVILFVHGGGLTVGHGQMEDAANLLAKAADGKYLQSCIHISVEYSLAPESPFPAAFLEVYSVLRHVLQRFSAVSLVGVSAGGNLALTTAWEVLRQPADDTSNDGLHPLRSIVAIAPMVDPACDSLSYYQNGRSALGCPSRYLRYCWRSYLNLPEPENEKDTPIPEKQHRVDDDSGALYRLLGRDSNRTVWQECPQFRSPCRRWIVPTEDIPYHKLQTKDAPRLVISTNTADALHSEGVALVKQLRQQGVPVRHLDHKGSHVFGTLHEKAVEAELHEAFRYAVFQQ